MPTATTDNLIRHELPDTSLYANAPSARCGNAGCSESAAARTRMRQPRCEAHQQAARTEGSILQAAFDAIDRERGYPWAGTPIIIDASARKCSYRLCQQPRAFLLDCVAHRRAYHAPPAWLQREILDAIPHERE